MLAVVVVAGVVGAVIVSGYISDAPAMPSREALWTIRRSPGMTFLDRNGQLIATRGAKYGQPVTLAQLPAYVPKAFLAAEDRRFYQHGPVDLQAIGRARRDQPPQAALGRGRLDADPAAGAHPVPEARAVAEAQGAGGLPRLASSSRACPRTRSSSST